jgi:hypothetical protein
MSDPLNPQNTSAPQGGVGANWLQETTTALPQDPLNQLFEVKVVRDMLEIKDKEFRQYGRQHAINGMPYTAESDALIFKAGAEEVLSFVKIEAEAYSKTAETIHSASVTKVNEAKERQQRLDEQVAKLEDQPMSKAGLWTAMGVIVMIGELPFAFMTFSDLVNLDEKLIPKNWSLIMAVSGAMGLVATMAAIKILVGFAFETLERVNIDGWRTMREKSKRHLRDGHFIPKILVLALSAWVFYGFVGYLAEYRSLSIEYSKLESERAVINLTADDAANQIVDKIAEMSAIKTKLGPAEKDLFWFYGLLFPIAGALFIVDGEFRSMRQQKMVGLKTQQDSSRSDLEGKERALLEHQKALANATSVAHAVVEGQGLADSFSKRFWWKYSQGFQEELYNTDRLFSGPGPFEKAELFRFRFN